MLNKLVPMLAVESVERTRDFYCGKLGFDYLAAADFEGRLGWCRVGMGGPSTDPGGPRNAEVMFTRRDPTCGGADRDTRDGVILYFYPEDVAALHSRYKSRGVGVSDLRVTIYRMKEFEVEDPDGYQVWFGQETSDPATVHED